MPAMIWPRRYGRDELQLGGRFANWLTFEPFDEQDPLLIIHYFDANYEDRVAVQDALVFVSKQE
jgi:predicted AAA+ superfamily ATPase